MSLVTIDVAFISLRHILPALPPFLEPAADVVALVKPQFEAGRDEVGKHGLVTDPAVHEAVIARVTEAAAALRPRARRRWRRPPITGATGNQEFFLHLTMPQADDRSSSLGAGAIGSLYAAKLAARHAVTVVARPRPRRRDRARRPSGRSDARRSRAACARRRGRTRIAPRHAGPADHEGERQPGGDRADRATRCATTRSSCACRTGCTARRSCKARGRRPRASCFAPSPSSAPSSSEPGRRRLQGRRLHADRGQARAAPAIAALLIGLRPRRPRVADDIKVEVWRKLIFNCVINPITVDHRHRTSAAIADPRLDPLKQLVIDECLQVARADGVAFDIDFVRTIAEVFGAVAQHRVDAAGSAEGQADRDRSHERRGRRSSGGGSASSVR